LLEEVRYEPNLKQKLISIGELTKKGRVFKGERRVLKVLRDLVMTKGVRKNIDYGRSTI